jgi:hypothetical protein
VDAQELDAKETIAKTVDMRREATGKERQMEDAVPAGVRAQAKAAAGEARAAKAARARGKASHEADRDR